MKEKVGLVTMALFFIAVALYGAWTEETMIEAVRGDLVPQLAAIGTDTPVLASVAQTGSTTAREMLNMVNDWLEPQQLPSITLSTLERYVAERVAAGFLADLAEAGAPLTSRLVAPAGLAVSGANVVWNAVPSAAKYYVFARYGNTVRRSNVTVRTIPIATFVSQLSVPSGNTFTVQTAARAVDGTLGWFTAPLVVTAP